MLNNKLQSVRRLASLLLFIAATCFGVASVYAQSFSRTDYAAIGNNHTLGDFNGDGILDIAGTTANGVAIMLGNANGTFRAKVAYPGGGFAQDLASGDFNGDGKLDLVVTINDPDIGLAVLTGNGDGSFSAPVTFPNSSRLDSPAVVTTDLDNDGRLDVVVAHQIACYTAPCVVGRTITVWLGFGDGTFQRPWEIEVGTGMSRIVASDFNRDAIKDLAIAGDRSQVYVLFGVGNGTFLQQPTIQLTADTLGVDATDIDLADFNNDGTADLVVAIALNGSRTAILLGNTDGTFRRPLIITEPGSRVPQYQVVGDFNRDGFEDLALSLGFGSNGLLEIRLGNGDGTFRGPTLSQQPPPKSSVSGGVIVTGDFNRDGKPDIALPITGASSGLAMLINSTGGAPAPRPTPTPAPTPVTLSTITVNPTSVVGGNSAQGTVTLSRPASGATVVQLASNNTAATLPASVTVAAGASSATFNINTARVTANRSVTISATLNAITRTATLTLTAPPQTPPATDTVRISRAEYDSGKRRLRVDATSTSANATLQVFNTSTGQLLGTLSNNGGGRYSGQLSVSSNPRNITVRSNLGGTATATVK